MMPSVLKRLGIWLRNLLRSRFRIVFVEEDAPEQPKPKILYLVMEAGDPWYAAMLCPCGCEETLFMNLIPDERPVWHLIVHEGNSATLCPSIQRKRGCHSHFWLRNGRIYWCREHKFSISRMKYFQKLWMKDKK